MTIGEKLKRARKKLNYDLDDVARETKIAKMFLIAIEKDDVSALPGGVYTRNFLRTYAQFLELDADIITAEFHDQFDIKPHFVLQQEQTKRDDSAFKQQRRQLLLVIGVIVLIAAIVLVLLYQPWVARTPPGVKTVPAAASTTVADAANDANTSPPPTTANVPALEVDAAPKLGVQNSPGTTLPKENEAVVGDSAGAAGASDLVADSGSADTAIVATQTRAGLPLTSLEGETLLAPAGVVGEAGLNDVFVIEALRDVRVEVYIDGEMLTNRRLPAGQRRVYRMGRLHVVKIWNIADVVVQSGDAVYRAPVGVSGSVLIEDFKPGEVLARLERAEVLPSKQEP